MANHKILTYSLKQTGNSYTAFIMLNNETIDTVNRANHDDCNLAAVELIKYWQSKIITAK